jgi:hypothetical protein
MVSLTFTAAWSVALYVFTGSRVKVSTRFAFGLGERGGQYIAVQANNTGRTPVRSRDEGSPLRTGLSCSRSSPVRSSPCRIGWRLTTR